MPQSFENFVYFVTSFHNRLGTDQGIGFKIENGFDLQQLYSEKHLNVNSKWDDDD